MIARTQYRYGIIGYPLGHSFSHAYFSEKFSRERIPAVYERFPLKTIHELPSLLQSNPDLCGLNVTIPYQIPVIPFLSELDRTAAAVGAVNCIHLKDGTRKGYNTDVTGFRDSLIPLLAAHHTRALILGTGGASRAAGFALQQLNIPYRLVSSSGKATLGYAMLDGEILSAHTLIINTTPLGMFPETDTCPPIPYHLLTPRHLLYDLVYNPGETKFLRLGKEHGTAVKNGMEMLILQAEASWRIWNS